MKKGILIVSFGTSYDRARERAIDVFEQEIKEKFPQHVVETAFTSNMVREILKERGIFVKDVPLAMEGLQQQGVQEVFVLSTHLIPGEEYEKLCRQVAEKETAFAKVTIAPPLLSNTERMQAVISVLAKKVQVAQEEALILFGHGTEHFSNAIYPALDYMAKTAGLTHIFVGTVEGYPDFSTVLQELQKAGYQKAVVTPLMLVAGDHAENDMAGDEEDSWKNKLEQRGITCRTVAKGMGEYEDIRQMYYETFLKIMK